MKTVLLKIKDVFKKEVMLSVSLIVAVLALFITPPSMKLLSDIDWKTLAILFMMLTVLEGFKKENIFLPIIRFSSKLTQMFTLSMFLVFGVFFTSMFVTNDVSLIIFVPLTILLFRAGGKEKYILPVLTFENIAAIRGSMLMPFGSPQNLFMFGKSGVSVGQFIIHMLPLNVFSGILLIVFIKVLYRKDSMEAISLEPETISDKWEDDKKKNRIVYILLFALVILTIVTRTKLWYVSLIIVFIAIMFTDRKLLMQTDYVLLLTFLCFFVFSSSITSNPAVSSFLKQKVAGNEYWWSLALSQAISNVPSTIVLYPFTKNLSALIYGADTAGLCSIIGSLASVINYRIYVREYPNNGMKFLKVFTLISWLFFLIVVAPGYFLSAWQL